MVTPVNYSVPEELGNLQRRSDDRHDRRNSARCAYFIIAHSVLRDVDRLAVFDIGFIEADLS